MRDREAGSEPYAGQHQAAEGYAVMPSCRRRDNLSQGQRPAPLYRQVMLTRPLC